MSHYIQVNNSNWDSIVKTIFMTNIHSQINNIEEKEYHNKIGLVELQCSSVKGNYKFYNSIPDVISEHNKSKRTEAILLGFAILIKIFHRYHVNVHIPFESMLRCLENNIIKITKKVKHRLYNEINDDDDDDDDNNNNNNYLKLEDYISLSKLNQDLQVYEMVVKEWNSYKLLLMNELRGKVDDYHLNNYLSYVRWKELCDTQSMKLKRTTDYIHSEEYKYTNEIPIMYSEPLWPKIDKMAFRNSQICWPFLGITYDAADCCYIDSLLNEYEELFKNDSINTENNIEKYFTEWYTNIKMLISYETTIQMQTWVFHQILQSSSDLIKIFTKIQTNKPTSSSLWSFINQHQTYNNLNILRKKYQSIIDQTNDNSTYSKFNILSTQLIGSKENTRHNNNDAAAAANGNDNDDDCMIIEQPPIRKYMDLTKWFNQTEEHIYKEYINNDEKKENNSSNNKRKRDDNDIDMLFEQFQNKMSNQDISTYLKEKNGELNDELVNKLEQLVINYAIYYWSGASLIWIKHSSKMIVLLKTILTKVIEPGQYINDKTKETFTKWLQVLQDKNTKLNQKHQEITEGNHIQLVKQLCESIIAFHHVQKESFLFLLWKTCLYNNKTNYKEKFTLKWNSLVSGQIAMIDTFMEDKTKNQLYLFFNYFKSIVEEETIFQQLYNEGCYQGHICSHIDNYGNDQYRQIGYITTYLKNECPTTTQFDLLYYQFNKYDLLNKQFNILKDKELKIDNIITIQLNTLLLSNITNHTSDYKSIINNFCTKFHTSKQLKTFSIPEFWLLFQSDNIGNNNNLKSICDYIVIKMIYRECLMYLYKIDE